jgi:hypothetical protein
MPAVAERVGSEEQAASLALSLLRESAIARFDEDNIRARTARQWFATARTETLRRNDWNFASTWVVPAAQPADALGQFKNQFPLPADCVCVCEVFDGGTGSGGRLGVDQWAIETAEVDELGAAAEVAMLVSNSETVRVRYTRDVTAVRSWDPQFLVAFAKQLAEYMAPAFGKSMSEASELGASAERKIDAAAARDAREKAPTTITRSTSWTRARTAWRSG